MGHRSPLRQHSGMDSDGGVGRGYPKKQGGGFRLVDSASMLFLLLSRPPFLSHFLSPSLLSSMSLSFSISLSLALPRSLSRISHTWAILSLLSPNV